MNMYRVAGLVLILLVLTAWGVENPPASDAGNLADLDLKALMQMDVKVTTASKTAESIYDVAAPIYVITADEMRRAGATSIPEALRLAPGVIVGQIDPGKWVVSLRGFGWQYANKALVLLDGRAVYTPLTSSIYWDSLDVPIEDIERIEVIRGPGDARWGSHAVNGVVNIITRRAGAVRGLSLSALLDTNASQTFTVLGGGALSSNFDYRAYAKYLSQGDFPMAPGVSRLGDRNAFRSGVRVDGESGGNRLTLIGDAQSGRDATYYFAAPPPASVTRYDADEWSALARWERGMPGSVNQQAQLSFDHLNQQLYEARDTFDFAYQAQLPEFRMQALTVGLTYKYTADVLPLSAGILPERLTQNTIGLFVHDRIALTDKARLMLGSQFEHNPFTGWEAQPDVQFLYTLSERRSYWASVSRAVRAPLRDEEGFRLDVPVLPGVVTQVRGNPDLQAERVLAWQAGARFAIQDNLFLDLAAFYNRYKDLVIMMVGAPTFEPLPPPGRLVILSTFENGTSADTKGVEVVLKARPFARWDLAASYSLYSQSGLKNSSGPPDYAAAVEHQFQIQSSAGLATHLDWNVNLYYTGPLTTGTVPDYYKLDTQLTWTPRKNLQLAIGVKNALDSRHWETGGNTIDVAAQIPRTGYLRALEQF